MSLNSRLESNKEEEDKNHPSVPFVTARVPVLRFERPLMDFCVVQTAKLTQFFRGIDFYPVYNQAITSLKAKSKGTGRFSRREDEWRVRTLYGYLEKGIQLPWREAGPPHHHDDKVDSDQWVVNKELSL